MPNMFLVVIEKEYAGEVWSNTHAFTVMPETAEVTEADLVKVIGEGLLSGITDAKTNPYDESEQFVGSVSPLGSIIAFERLLHFEPVQFKRVYITDGKQPNDTTPVFATFPVNFGGLVPLPIGDVIAPLTNVLQIDRVPYGFSSRAGRMQLRACLLRTDVLVGPVDGIDLEPSKVEFITTRIGVAADNSFIYLYYWPGVDQTDIAKYAIPKYAPKGDIYEGKIVGRSLISGLQLDGAKNRQVQRGKKKTTAPAP